MTPKTKIKRIVEQQLKTQNISIEELHSQTNTNYIDDFWADCCNTWMDYCFRTREAEANYRWDAEFQEFWDHAEKIWPEYILKPLSKNYV